MSARRRKRRRRRRRRRRIKHKGDITYKKHNNKLLHQPRGYTCVCGVNTKTFWYFVDTHTHTHTHTHSVTMSIICTHYSISTSLCNEGDTKIIDKKAFKSTKLIAMSTLK